MTNGIAFVLTDHDNFSGNFSSGRLTLLGRSVEGRGILYGPDRSRRPSKIQEPTILAFIECQKCSKPGGFALVGRAEVFFDPFDDFWPLPDYSAKVAHRRHDLIGCPRQRIFWDIQFGREQMRPITGDVAGRKLECNCGKRRHVRLGTKSPKASYLSGNSRQRERCDCRCSLAEPIGGLGRSIDHDCWTSVVFSSWQGSTLEAPEQHDIPRFA